MKHRYSRFLPAFTLTIDLLLMNAVLSIQVSGPLSQIFDSSSYSAFLIFAHVTWIILSIICGTYITSRAHFLKYSIYKLISTTCFHLIALSILTYLYPKFAFANLLVGGFYIGFLAFGVLIRYLLSLFLHLLRSNGYNARAILIVGEKTTSTMLIQHFSNHPEYGYDLVFTDFNLSWHTINRQRLDDLVEKKPDQIFFCYENIDEKVIDFLSEYFEGKAVVAKVVSNVLITNNYRSLINCDTLPMIRLNKSISLGKRIKALKRTFDVLFSVAIMFIGLPVFILLCIITYLTSKGPVFFKQERVGLEGRPFTILKFRSMRVDSEMAGPQLSKDNDPRITGWGKIMRKTRLDELPQFWNVFKGDMSVVGPRPERMHYIEQISERKARYRKLLTVKPGITSIGQVYYGYAENIDQMCERMEYDLLYLEDVTFNSDVRLIANTIKVMVQGKGK